MGWCLVAVLGGILICGAHAGGQTTAFWLNPVTGSWTDPTNWSSNPVFPNNGTETFDVTIAATGSPYSVLFNNPAVPVTVDTLDIRSPNATLVHSTGALTLGRFGMTSSTPLHVGNGGRYRLTGGSLHLATFHLSLVGSEGAGSFTQEGGTVRQRGNLIVGLGGGGLGSGIGSLTIQGGEWLRDPAALDIDGTTIGVGPKGTGSFSLGFASATFEPLSVGNALANGALEVHSGGQLTANRLDIGNGPWTVAGSTTSGFGVATLSGGTSRITLTFNGSFPGRLFLGGGSDGLGSGRLVIQGGALETQLTIITPTGVLDVRGGRALMGTILGMAGSVMLSGGSISIDSCTLSQGGRVDVSGGSLLISRLSVNSGTQSIVASGGGLSIASFTQNSGISSFTGNSVLTSNGIAIGGSAQFNVAGGTVNSPLLTMTGGNVNFSGGMFNISNLQISDGRFTLAPGANVRLDVNSLNVDGPGILDLADNPLSIDYSGPSPIDEIAEDVARAYANGAWTGTGITSSLANAVTHGVGYGDFASSSVIVHLTRYGDANLDDLVNLFDFNALAANFGASGARWDEGDFNYDGLVNLSDFNLLAGNFGMSASADGPTAEDWAALAAAVPEPGILAFLGGATLVGVLAHPNRRR